MHLLIDADDTLWEEAIHFREAVYTLAKILKSHHTKSHDDILNVMRQYLSVQQNIDIAEHGLGPRCFFISLQKVLQQVTTELALEHTHDALLLELQQIQHDFYHKPLTVRRNVEATLAALRKKPFKLYLYTQGEFEHQQSKLQRSLLEHYFHEKIIIPMKTVDNLKDILHTHKIPPQEAIVIGNSTRSDINPAKELGLKTIHCKHPYTWERENHPMLEKGPRTHVVEDFGDILEILAPVKVVAV